jgi:hypothetical protein
MDRLHQKVKHLQSMAIHTKDKMKLKSLLKEQDDSFSFNYDMHIEAIEGVMEALEAAQRDLVGQLEAIAEDENVYGMVADKAEQSVNVISRYIGGAEKQLEGIVRLLEQAKTRRSYDA